MSFGERTAHVLLGAIAQYLFERPCDELDRGETVFCDMCYFLQQLLMMNST